MGLNTCHGGVRVDDFLTGEAADAACDGEGEADDDPLLLLLLLLLLDFGPLLPGLVDLDAPSLLVGPPPRLLFVLLVLLLLLLVLRRVANKQDNGCFEACCCCGRLVVVHGASGSRRDGQKACEMSGELSKITRHQARDVEMAVTEKVDLVAIEHSLLRLKRRLWSGWRDGSVMVKGFQKVGMLFSISFL